MKGVVKSKPMVCSLCQNYVARIGHMTYQRWKDKLFGEEACGQLNILPYYKQSSQEKHAHLEVKLFLHKHTKCNNIDGSNHEFAGATTSF